MSLPKRPTLDENNIGYSDPAGCIRLDAHRSVRLVRLISDLTDMAESIKALAARTPRYDVGPDEFQPRTVFGALAAELEDQVSELTAMVYREEDAEEASDEASS